MDDYERNDFYNAIEQPPLPQDSGMTQDNGTPQDSGVQTRSIRGFALASMIFGVSSILLCCTGLLPLPLGALGTLFAILSRRRAKPMSGMGAAGMVTSIIGMVMGIVIIAYLAAMVAMAFNPDTRPYLDRIYQNAYGMTFEEFMEYVGYPLE